jgi:CrcB protein
VTRFFWICFAGALGTGARYLVGLGATKWLGTSFPWGTLIVNVVGCFLIALVMEIAAASSAVSPTMRLVLTTGFMGGFTTYSAFNYETTKLFGERWSSGVVYAGVTIAACLVAGVLGTALAQRLELAR